MKKEIKKILISVEDKTIIEGVAEFEKIFKEKIKNKELEKSVKLSRTGTFGVNTKGISIVIYPGGVLYSDLKIHDIDKILNQHILKGIPVQELMPEPISERLSEHGFNPEEAKNENRIVLSNVGKINPESIDEYITSGGYNAVKAIAEEGLEPKDIIDIIKESGLRGRGGAGFPTGLKWEITAKESSDEKYIICNADEGEPGTSKDRLILEGDPHRIIEGMIIAGYAVGAEKGYIYIRGEYKISVERVVKAIKDAYKKELLGKDILGTGFTFDIELKKGAGAYVCGEETALIESIEGRRGNPRIKPPYPGEKGLHNQPTVVNNVETLANIAPIIVNGSKWFHSFGTEDCPGTKVFTLVGDIKYPGIIELPMGVTLREIVFGFGGGIKADRGLKAIHLGGSSGAVFDKSFLDVPLDFDSVKKHGGLLGSGSVLVIDNETDMRNYLENVLLFFKHESCGQCIPCRIGTARLYDLVKKLDKNGQNDVIISNMEHLTDVMFKSSLCPLGQSLVYPVKSIFKNFGNEFK